MTRATLRPLSSRRLTAYYLCCLLIIAGVASVFHAVFVHDTVRDSALNSIVNKSGRQRMLSQRIANLVAEYRMGDTSARAPLLASADELLANQRDLTAASLADPSTDADALAIRKIYFGQDDALERAMAGFVTAARAVAALPPGAPGGEAAEKLVFAEARAPLLDPLNEVVERQVHRNKVRLGALRDLGLASLVTILATLAAEANFLFRPMIRLLAQRFAEAQAANEALEKERELLSVTLNGIGDGVITTDPHGLVTWLNPVAEVLTGWPNAAAKGQPIEKVFAIVQEATLLPAINPVAVCLAEHRVVGMAANTILQGRGGKNYAVEDSASPIRAASGEILGVVLVFRDVTQQHRLAGEMTYRATHDMLTGLLNRGEFDTRLEYSLHKAKSDQTANAILFIDLDQFKVVNDTCGHAAGDQLLVQVSRLLTSLVRAGDSVARLGGDEFAILLDRCPMSHAQALAQKLCDRLEEFRFSFNDQRFRVGASIGLAPIDSRWTDGSALLHAVDSCCYAAKLAGRNRVHVWSESDQGMRARHGEVQWAAQLEQALDCNQFVLFAQRIDAVGDKKLGVHAEILLRMSNADGSLLAPGAFLPAAERFHMASRVDRWVLSKAFALIRAAPNLDEIEMLAINLSGQSVADAAFQRWVLAELADAGPRVARRICLEITETAAVTDLANASAFIEQLKAIGVRVALDDFGAGASSFGYLKFLAVDYLKIDGQFVRDILTDKLDDAAVRCFVEIAGLVGMRTIAEYTESAEVLRRLEEMGIDFAQGFHVHKPAPIEQLIAAYAESAGV